MQLAGFGIALVLGLVTWAVVHRSKLQSSYHKFSDSFKTARHQAIILDDETNANIMSNINKNMLSEVNSTSVDDERQSSQGSLIHLNSKDLTNDQKDLLLDQLDLMEKILKS